MERLQWKNEYELGLEEVDEQHKKLLVIINKLYAMDPGDKEILSDVLNELTDYTFYHFSTEEEIMKNEGSPYLRDHSKEHRFFIEQTAGLCLSLLKGEGDIYEELCVFLKEWLINHILERDKATFTGNG